VVCIGLYKLRGNSGGVVSCDLISKKMVGIWGIVVVPAGTTSLQT